MRDRHSLCSRHRDNEPSNIGTTMKLIAGNGALIKAPTNAIFQNSYNCTDHVPYYLFICRPIIYIPCLFVILGHMTIIIIKTAVTVFP